jgi:hypothetical protein
MVPIPESVFLTELAGQYYAELQEKLAVTKVPCRTQLQIFDNPEKVSQKQAKIACHGCPLIKECGNFAAASKQEYGIWGGVNYTRRRYKNGDEWFDVKESSNIPAED